MAERRWIRYVSISRISCLVTIRQLSIHGNVGTRFWGPDVLPDVNQLGLGKRRFNLATSDDDDDDDDDDDCN